MFIHTKIRIQKLLVFQMLELDIGFYSWKRINLKKKTSSNFKIMFTRQQTRRQKPLMFEISELCAYVKSFSMDR